MKISFVINTLLYRLAAARFSCLIFALGRRERPGAAYTPRCTQGTLRIFVARAPGAQTCKTWQRSRGIVFRVVKANEDHQKSLSQLGCRSLPYTTQNLSSISCRYHWCWHKVLQCLTPPIRALRYLHFAYIQSGI